MMRLHMANRNRHWAMSIKGVCILTGRRAEDERLHRHFRNIEQSTQKSLWSLEWKLKARWKVVTFNATERELAVREIGFRAEQPLNSTAYKEAVLPTILREVDDESAGPPFHMHSCGCLNGRFELKATDEYTGSVEAHTVPALV